jgi:hypothetical protein
VQQVEKLHKMATVSKVDLSQLDRSSVYPGLKIAGPCVMMDRKVSRKKKDSWDSSQPVESQMWKRADAFYVWSPKAMNEPWAQLCEDMPEDGHVEAEYELKKVRGEIDIEHSLPHKDLWEHFKDTINWGLDEGDGSDGDGSCCTPTCNSIAYLVLSLRSSALCLWNHMASYVSLQSHHRGIPG